MTDLLERDAELAALRERLAAARLGTGGVLVVEGPAGAGKSALLVALRTDASGFRVRAAVAGELEREFAFGVVHQLLDPVLRGADPGERERLLAGAAATVGPLFGVGTDAPPTGADGTFAVLHGLFWLVAALAETAPLLLVVDDLHWADEPSLRFCDFLARRAADLPLLLVLGLRPGERPEADDLVADTPDVTVLRPPPLSATATHRLVGTTVGEPVAEDVARSAHEATGGNPLLVSELARTLAGWDGALTTAVVDAAVPSSVARSTQRRLRRLDPEAAAIAAALAVLGDRLPADVLAAVVGVDGAAAALGALRTAGLVDADRRFQHPLIRQAVADAMPAAEQGTLHRRAAEALRGRAGLEEQAVTHLLAAPPLGATWAADLLRAAAARAMGEGAADLAVRRLRRAVEETAGTDPGLLAELGMAALAAGDPQAVDHLAAAEAAGATRGGAATGEDGAARSAASGPDDASAGMAAAALAFRVAIDVGDTPRQRDALARATDLAADGGPPQLVWAGLNALTGDPSLPDARARLLELARAAADPDTLPMLALDAAGAGRGRDEVAALIDAFVAAEGRLGLPGLEGGNTWGAIAAATVVEATDAAAPVLAQLQRAGARGTSRIAAYFDNFQRGAWEATFGSLPLADALLRGALERCGELTDVVLEQSARAQLIGALVGLGRLDEADALAAEAADDRTGPRFVACTWLTRRAELRAAQGRWPAALTDLQRVEAELPAWGWTRFPIGHGEALHARALLEVGRAGSGDPRARPTARATDTDDRRAAQPVAAAGADALEEGRARAEAALAAAQARGIAADEAHALIVLGHARDGDAGLEARAAAVDAAMRSPSKRVQATAALELGIGLRRAGRRKDARAALATAREAASRAGAAGLLTRATEELAVAGGRPQRVAVSGVDALTPSERRVAEHAARGLSNREIAEALFVTRKTVEFTLGRVFSKLDIKSRAQLPDHLR